MVNLTPRERRLQSDFQDLERLASESPVFRFEVGHRWEGRLPESYVFEFHGPSLVRELSPFESSVKIREFHQVHVSLGPQYPRLMPSLQWITPIFHPNISSTGAVCLGGYSSFWVPSLMLDKLCEMLWDMLCFRNLNLESPYNREAAAWLAQQKTFSFPLCPYPLRSRVLGIQGATKIVPEPPEPGTEIQFLS